MNARAFQYWMGRIGLAAALLLLSVPTAGRFIHVSQAGGDAQALHGDAGHHGHRGHHAIHGHADGGDARDGDGAPQRPAPGDSDCDYCPLLASLAATQQVLFTVPVLLPVPAALVAAEAPRLPWVHPSGLGSRGPPHHG